MSVNYANNWDAAKILREMTPEQKQHFKEELAARKLLHAVFKRTYNKDVCAFVEKRLEEEDNG